MNVLAVGAHHDDIEIGCGGTLARLGREGHQIYGVTLTNSETHDEVQGIHRSTHQAREEGARAAAVLGVTLLELEEASVDNGTLTYDVKVMRALERVIATQQISMVFSHWQGDLNTDHEAAARMTIVAARHVPTVLMYRSNWYQSAAPAPFHGSVLVDISEVIELKRRSLACYEGEIRNRGAAWLETFIERERIAGFSLRRQYAESFEPVRVELFPGR